MEPLTAELNKLITRSIFWGYDILKQRQISSYFKAISKANGQLNTFNSAALSAYLEGFGSPYINDWPLMEKQDLIHKSQNFKTNKKYTYAYTGGSTGEPLKIPYSTKRQYIRTASIKYYNEIGNYFVGDRFLFIRAKPKSKLNQFLRNEILCIPTQLDENFVESLTEKIVYKKVESIIGYPTVTCEIAKCLSARPDLKKRCRVKSIISVSEPLEEAKRKFINDVFKCTFIDRYSTEEVGVIAQQYEFGGDYIPDRYGIYVELLDPVSLRPVSKGEEGRVVVTDINADIIPIIRYDTGDNAIAGDYIDGQLASIKNIIGRSADRILNTSGEPISSLAFGPLIHRPFSERNIQCQFQLVQLDENQYEIRLGTQNNVLVSEACTEVKKNIKPVLGKDASIRFNVLKEIPALPSGKRPLYLNLHQRNQGIS